MHTCNLNNKYIENSAQNDIIFCQGVLKQTQVKINEFQHTLRM